MLRIMQSIICWRKAMEWASSEPAGKREDAKVTPEALLHTGKGLMATSIYRGKQGAG